MFTVKWFSFYTQYFFGDMRKKISQILTFVIACQAISHFLKGLAKL